MFIELDNNIVGYSSIWTLSIIGREAKSVKPNGWIVEIGSFCGRSTYVLGKNKHDSVKLTCVDNWPGPPSEIPDSEFVFGNINSCFNYSEFRNNVHSIKNLETLRCTLPLNLSNMRFSVGIDLLFFDLYPDHDLYVNQLLYWHRFMGDGSKIIVNDYSSNRNAVDEFCGITGLQAVDDMNLALIGVENAPDIVAKN